LLCAASVPTEHKLRVVVAVYHNQVGGVDIDGRYTEAVVGDTDLAYKPLGREDSWMAVDRSWVRMS
jgi:hypothetical protein